MLPFEAVEWSMFGLINSSNNITSCGSAGNSAIIGGIGVFNYNGYIQRIFYNLPPHNIVYFSISFFLIDNFQTGDHATVTIDSKTFSTGDFSLSKSLFPTNICGASQNDLLSFYVLGKVFHSTNTITIKITSKVNQNPNTASFGVRQVTVNFANAFANDTEGTCSSSSQIDVADNSCGCRVGTYQNPLDTSQCLACHSLCQTCFGPNPTQCYMCNLSAQASWVNGECIKCDSTCATCFGPSSNQCTRCANTNFHKYDYSCPSSCDSPAYAQQNINGVVLICMLPCNTGEFYATWNKSCVASCAWPVTQRPMSNLEFTVTLPVVHIILVQMARVKPHALIIVPPLQ